MKNLGIYDCELKLNYKNFILLQVMKRFKYDESNNRTEELDGYNATVMVADAENALLTVKVKDLVGLTDNNIASMPKVHFDNMVVKPYSKNFGERSRIEISVSADKIIAEK